MKDTLRNDLTSLLNSYSRENASNTPDFLLAEFMLQSLAAYEHVTVARDKWYGFSPWAGNNSCGAEAPNAK